MNSHTFFCIDGHTCGNPVRLVAGGAPPLDGRHDERAAAAISCSASTGSAPALMFEPRGHDMMSGSILYPPTRPDCDVGILFIETSGCLPMCGHGTIGTVTFAHRAWPGDAAAREGVLQLDAPAGVVEATYTPHRRLCRRRAHPQRRLLPACRGRDRRLPGARRTHLRRRLWRQLLRHPRAAEELPRTRPTSPPATSCGCRRSCAACSTTGSSRCIRRTRQSAASATSCGPGRPRDPKAHARNAVFYGDKAIDRSPCGTGTSARMAQLAAKGKLEGRRRLRPREHHRQPVQRPRRSHGRASATTRPSSRRSRAGRASPATTPSSSTTATRIGTGFRWCKALSPALRHRKQGAG